MMDVGCCRRGGVGRGRRMWAGECDPSEKSKIDAENAAGSGDVEMSRCDVWDVEVCPSKYVG